MTHWGGGRGGWVPAECWGVGRGGFSSIFGATRKIFWPPKIDPHQKWVPWGGGRGVSVSGPPGPKRTLI